ncbi:MAG TPA: hypothetical protein VIL30_18695 [Ramlibacter sp.]|jgi:hypothetical protein
MNSIEAVSDDLLVFGYTNWRGEYAERTAIPLRIEHKESEWHGPGLHWVMVAFDVEKQAERDFLLKDLGLRSPIQGEVKALEWVDGPRGHYTEYAESPVGQWAVWEIQGSAYYRAPDETAGKRVGETKDEAKAAAQTDFNARILSCLAAPEPIAETVAIPMVDALRDAEVRLREIEKRLRNPADYDLEQTYALGKDCGRMADGIRSILTTPPSPKPEAVSDEMVERAYEAFVAACEWSDWDEPEVRGYIRQALTAALSTNRSETP